MHAFVFRNVTGIKHCQGTDLVSWHIMSGHAVVIIQMDYGLCYTMALGSCVCVCVCGGGGGGGGGFWISTNILPTQWKM